MKNLFIIGNDYNLSTSYEVLKNFLIEKYIGTKADSHFYFEIPEMRMPHHGEMVVDKEYVAVFLENIISMTESNGEKMECVRRVFRKIGLRKFFDNLTDVYNKERDIDLWKTRSKDFLWTWRYCYSYREILHRCRV